MRHFLPSQFGLRDLFVLTTAAAIACGIVRLPLARELKGIALIMLWLGLMLFVARGRGSQRTRRVRAAVLRPVGHAIGMWPILAGGLSPKGMVLTFSLPILLLAVAALVVVAATIFELRAALRVPPDLA